MNHTFRSFLPLAVFLLLGLYVAWQPAEPWHPDQLLEPAQLASALSNPSAKKPLLISIGPAGGIKSSVEVGQTRDTANVAKLVQLLSKEPRQRDIVLYCGCCPFRHCPNIRPAFAKLNQMGFKNHKLLNLSTNLKTDWIDKGYPMEE